MKIATNDFAKKSLSIILAIIIAIPFISIPNVSYGATFKDIRGHWAESYINKAVSAGFVKGYPDGTYSPDRAVSRAEFTSMVNKALGNSSTTSVSFKDVPYSEWYYNDVAKGLSAGFVGGYDDNTFRPNNAVTREEAAVMIARFVPTYGVSGNTSAFKDRLSISSWASDSVARIYGKGYMGAYDDGKYHPQDSLTRGQTAKILCSILDKETIVSSSTVIKSKGSTLSNRIYSNNVTMHSDLGTGEAEVSNCVILGNLYVNGGGENSIIVSNSRVANATVEKSSGTVRLLAKGQTTINKVTTGNDAILETSGLSGGLMGTGFNDVDIKSSADTILRGSFTKVNIVGSSANVNIASGSITALNVSSSGRNSEVKVDSRASIGTATVNAATAFKGSGSINTMNVNSSGVTYETKPRNVKLGSGISSPNIDDYDDDYDISVSPRSGATKVKVDTEITLTFNTAVTKYNGSTIRDSDISDMIYLRRGSSSGSKVSYSGSISSSKKVITLTPDSDLDDDTKYYVVIAKNEFMDSKDKGNSAQTTYFTTGDESDDTVKLYPKNGATSVSRSVSPTITFSQSVETYNGKSITNSYLDDSVIILREGSSSGSRVSFSASINSSKKTITIEPKSNLKEGQKYYLALVSKKFRTQSGSNNIGSYSCTWTVNGSSTPTVSITPSNGAASVDTNANINVQFSTAVYDTGGSSPSTAYIISYITLRNTTDNVPVLLTSSSPINSGGGTYVTLKPTSPLISGKSYTLTIMGSRFKSSSGNYMGEVNSSFKVGIDSSKIDAAIAVANSAKAGVKTSSVGGSDVFTSVYWVPTSDMNALDAAIVAANNAKSTVTNTAQIDAAVAALNNSIVAFNAAKNKGSKLDTSSISDAISKGKEALVGVTSSADGMDVEQDKLWATPESIKTLNTAIDVAQAVVNKPQDLATVVKAAATMGKAVSDFNATVTNGKKADKTALLSAITAATKNLSSVEISSQNGTNIDPSKVWVTTEVWDAYSVVISAAATVYDLSNPTQPEVNDALSKLNSATNTFNGQKQNGTKPPDPQPPVVQSVVPPAQ